MVQKFDTLDSDHFVLRINYLTEKINHQIIKPKIIINYKNMEVDILSIKLENIHTIRDFELILEDLLKKHTIQVTTNNKNVPKYWWNNFINNLWLIKTHKLKLFNKYINDYTKIEYKKAKAKLKLNIKKSKKENFRQFINEINPNTSIKEIYSKINIFNDKKHKTSKYNFNDQKLTDFLDFNYKNHLLCYTPNFNIIIINQ